MRLLFFLIILIGLGLVFFVSGCNSYNGFVEMDEDVENVWLKVQSVYQCCVDLILNFVNIVKGVVEFEKSILIEVMQVCFWVMSVNIDFFNLSVEKLQEFQQVQGVLLQLLGCLFVVFECYL